MGYFSGNIEMQNVSYCSEDVNILSYSVVFIPKIPEVFNVNASQYLQERFRHATLLKGDSNTGVFVLILQTFKNTYFEEHLLAAASEFLSCSTRVSSCFCIDSFIKFKSFINRLLTGNN